MSTVVLKINILCAVTQGRRNILVHLRVHCSHPIAVYCASHPGTAGPHSVFTLSASPSPCDVRLGTTGEESES